MRRGIKKKDAFDHQTQTNYFSSSEFRHLPPSNFVAPIMRTNENTVLIGGKVVLVPYDYAHVPVSASINMMPMSD